MSTLNDMKIAFHDFIDSKGKSRRIYRKNFIKLRTKQLEDGKPCEIVDEFCKAMGYDNTLSIPLKKIR